MNCPVCNIALTMSERQGIEIDYCPQCRGVWLDRGELDKIIERSSSIPKEKTEKDRTPPGVIGKKKTITNINTISENLF